jgi:archaellum biogenesis ATPase FlaH
MDRLELSILKNLIYNEEYTRKVLPFIKEDFFTDTTEKNVFKEVRGFIDKYKTLPTHEALVINFTESSKRTEEEVRSAVATLKDIDRNKDQPTDQLWLVEQTEKFCQDKAIYNAIMESVSILDDSTGTKAKGEIPQLLTDALAISFDRNVGHDYVDDYQSRFDFYHKVESRVKFDLDLFNKITKGGLPLKTLNICLAGTGVGKSMFMCHMAASSIAQGLNVLYITMEMAEERIAERIDANLLNVSLSDIENISKQEYEKRFANLKSKTHGKMIIKEYPTAGASVLHFKSLINELKLKKNFKPDIVFIDYLNICASSRIKQGGSVNSYTYIKSIAEELRGFAVENNVPVVSATQTTRSGFSNTDVGLEDTSESFGLPATADFMFALISTEELEQLGQIMVKQLKNRYSDPNSYKRFVVGVDRSKMRLYDAEQSAQTDISDSGQNDKPVNSFGNRESKFNNVQGIKL